MRLAQTRERRFFKKKGETTVAKGLRPEQNLDSVMRLCKEGGSAPWGESAEQCLDHRAESSTCKPGESGRSFVHKSEETAIHV